MLNRLKQVEGGFLVLHLIFKLAFPMSTTQFAVSMNGQPRIMGISTSSSMSMITKSTRKVSWWTLTRTSSTTPNGLVMERSASWSVILIEAVFKFMIRWHMDMGIKLMLAPRSMRVFPMDTYPIEHGMITFPRSLSLCSRFLWITALQLPLPLCSHCWYISLSLCGSYSRIWYMKASAVKPL